MATDGMNGFLITCVMNREESAYREFLAKTEGLPLHGPQPCQFPVGDFAGQLRSELHQLRSKRRFTKADAYKSILLVSNCTSLAPSEIFTLLRGAGLEFHNILRILPLDTVMRFDEEKIRAFIEERRFSGSFKILYEGRLCDPAMKERIFQAIIPLIPCRVSLDSPDYVVIVQVFRAHVGLAVVKNDPRGYNFSINSKERRGEQ